MGTTAAPLTIYDLSGYMPLTTIFTPPKYCSERPYTDLHNFLLLFVNSSSSSGVGDLPMFRRGAGLGYGSECYPSGYDSIPTYFPGVCPYGWSEYATGTHQVWNSTTTAMCCPSGMIIISNQCAKIVSTPTTVVKLVSWVTSGSSWVSATSRITHPFTAAEEMILVGWASNDLNKFTPASAPLLKAVATTASDHNLKSPTSNPAPSGLTVKTKAWIAVGTIGAVLLFVLLVFLLARARRYHIERKRGSGNIAKVDRELIPGTTESDGTAIHEANEESKPAEADSSSVRFELEGNWHGHEAATRTPR